MNWEPWSCMNDDCGAATWLAQRSAAQLDLWWIAADRDDRPFSVAAPTPICPRCGTTLEMAYMFELNARPAALSLANGERALADDLFAGLR
jgi:hypothetical protein